MGETRNIPFGRPTLDQAEIDAVVKVLSGPQLVHGPVTRAFEERFAQRAGSLDAVAVSSCTAGLHLTLHIRDIGPGDRVAVPAMTHVATAHAVGFTRAEPVFVDVEAESGNIDPDALADAADGGLNAIMVVHYLGLPCTMDRIMAIADGAGAFVVEDCALAVDATYGGKKAGNFGLTGNFSFYPVKHMTSIEGGMVTVNDADMAAKLRQYRAFGYDNSLESRPMPGIYDVNALGFNYRMNEVEAAVGLTQMDKLDAIQKARKANHAALTRELADIEELTLFPARRGKAISSHYCFNVVLPRDGSLDRNAIAAELKAQGIGYSVHYPRAVPLLSYYREKYGYRSGQFPNAEWLGEQTLSLPVGPHLTAEDPQRIAEALKQAIVRTRG